MEWIDRLNQSITYIENNLDKEISYEEASRVACCSTFHFQRMFSYIAGVSLSEYIRRRRMTKAAYELQNSGIKICDLAEKYGYDSPTSFSRAFQGIHTISPSAAREKGSVITSYQPISFSLTIKGDKEMKYRLEEKSAFRIVGTKIHMEMDIDECFAKVPQFWGECYQNGMSEKIAQLINQSPYGLLGISTCMGGTDLDYYIAASTDKPIIENTNEYTVPACTWAIFECVGAMTNAIELQDLQRRIVTEWLPNSGYEYANAPDIELYPAGDITSPEYAVEIWLPISKMGDK